MKTSITGIVWETGRWIWFCIAILLLTLVGLILFRTISQLKSLTGSRTPEVLDTPTILRQIQGLQQLTTVEYHLERVVAITDPGLLGDERLILIAHGVVKGGIDLSRVHPEDIYFDPGTRTAQVILPPGKILDVYLDEGQTRVFMREKPFFRKFNKDLDQLARRDAIVQIKSAAQELGIKQDAQQRAELQVRKMFELFGVRKVTIKFSGS